MKVLVLVLSLLSFSLVSQAATSSKSKARNRTTASALGSAGEVKASASEEVRSSHTVANILKGNMQVNGTIAIGSAGGFSGMSGAAASSGFSVAPSFQYFIQDHLSVGGTVNLSSYGNTYLSVGPAATYYFWTKDQFAAFGAASLSFALANPTYSVPSFDGVNFSTTSTPMFPTATLGIAGGVSYFLSQQVAFSPALTLSKNFGELYGSQGLQAGVYGAFGIFF